jgi:hypothetical protein
MAGKIIADQIEHSTAGSLDTSYVVNGSSKAWYKASSSIVFQGTLNIGSGVDNGTGNYTFNFTNSMADTDYTAPCGAASGGDRTVTLSSAATSSITMESFLSNAGSNTDATTMAAVFGDLA